MSNELYRKLPKMDDLICSKPIKILESIYGREQVIEALRQAMQVLRERIAQGKVDEARLTLDVENLPDCTETLIKQSNIPSLRRVINATGVPLHTNLGRAPLAEEAIAAVVQAARGYSTLEYDLETGERGSRHDHVRELLCTITGAEDAMVVNNNAGAVLIALSALARGKEVIVSRGQLVEVGGAFRIPDVMEQGGALLKEVGTTNKTHTYDYEQAITDNTAALLKVHTSNFRIIGFTEQVSTQDLTEICRRRGLLAIEDLGSGVLLSGFGEPTVQETVASGMDVVTFSGDKLMGGPQAGLIVGKAECLARIRKHPLARALRVDKMTLAALEATLRLYRFADTTQNIPVVRMLTYSEQELRSRAETLCAQINVIGLSAEVVAAAGQVGGGSLPGVEIPGYAVFITPAVSCTALEQRLRHATVPVIVRIAQDKVVIDPRAILQADMDDLLKSLQEAVSPL